MSELKVYKVWSDIEEVTIENGEEVYWQVIESDGEAEGTHFPTEQAAINHQARMLALPVEEQPKFLAILNNEGDMYTKIVSSGRDAELFLLEMGKEHISLDFEEFELISDRYAELCDYQENYLFGVYIYSIDAETGETTEIKQ